MTTLSYINARRNLASVMKHTTDNCEPVAITRKGYESVVVMSQKEYNSMAETLHLLSSTANAERLNQGLKDFERNHLA